jgi:hypothetical protein
MLHKAKARSLVASFFVLTMLLSVEAVQAQSRQHCNLAGSVYVVKERPRAMYRVYIEPSEAFADMHVVKVDNKLFADRGGLWHFTDTFAAADFTIYIETERSLADFSIHFIETESFAGCRD